MSASAARYEPQVGLAAAAPPVPLEQPQPPDELLPSDPSADEAASLLPHASVARSEPSTAAVSRLRRGFYAYSVASEVRCARACQAPPLPPRLGSRADRPPPPQVFVIVAGTLFLPVVLETYARENGRLAPAFEAPCPPSGLGQPPGGGAEERDQARCAVRVLGVWVDTGACRHAGGLSSGGRTDPRALAVSQRPSRCSPTLRRSPLRP